MSTPDLPFGDPCPRCAAATIHEDPRDRVCSCSPCCVCEAPTGNVCGYCDRSLGCHEHNVSSGRHIETYCLATPEQRSRLDQASPKDKREVMRELHAECRTVPKPWPAPVPPFEPGLPPPWLRRAKRTTTTEA